MDNIPKIKIRRKEYQPAVGDYIQYNGFSYMFCSGDNRVLRYIKYTNYTYVVLTKTALKKIPLTTMRKVVKESSRTTRWYF